MLLFVNLNHEYAALVNMLQFRIEVYRHSLFNGYCEDNVIASFFLLVLSVDTQFSSQFS